MKAENNREEFLFREALRRASGPERKAFLSQACTGNPALCASLDPAHRLREQSSQRHQGHPHSRIVRTREFNARPHPGPLPQERGRHSPRWWKPTPQGVGAVLERRSSNATDATKAIDFSTTARRFSLSPGERAGVRASLPLTFPRVHYTLWASVRLTFGGTDYPGPSISGQGVWRPLLQSVENCIPHGLALAAQPRVPKTQFLDSESLEESGALCVIGLSNRMAMLESVQFNRESGLLAEEVQNVLSGRMLASELIPGEAPVPQPTPKEFLRPGGFLAERAREIGVGHGGQPRTAQRNRKHEFNARPHPGPLPQERGRHSPRWWKPTPQGVGAVLERRSSNATEASKTIELSNSGRRLPLSPGERAGVRASPPLATPPGAGMIG